MNASRRPNEKAPTDLIAHLRMLAATRPSDTALIVAAAETEISIQYAELDRRVRAVAAELQARFAPNDRALLLLDNNEHYVVGFLACLYAGLIAVPAFPPQSLRDQHVQRLRSIAADAQASCVLVSSDLLETVGRAKDLLKNMEQVVVDAIPPDDADRWSPRASQDSDVLFLQYTSGSTAAPKGVIVDHGNLLANELVIREAMQTGPSDVFVSWLPLFHDMGLVGGLFQPLYAGIPLVLASPSYFLERPVRWLELISRHRATMSGGPDFAYRLCLERVSDEQIERLDLSSWRVAFCGAEPIRHDTLHAFAERFKRAGFNAQALYPCYGLAEATLFVTGGACDSGVTARTYSGDRLAKGRAVKSKIGTTLIGCGAPPSRHRLRIVDPVTGIKRPNERVGEIWISGPSISRGYWRREEETAETFVEQDGKRWLRTGDLGFVHHQQLYITGRQKDLIILRGHNVYPQDIERAIETQVEAVRKGRVAAFAVQTQAGEGVGVAVEVSRGLQKLIPPERLFNELNTVVAQVCNEPLQVAVLLNPGGLPKTSSGKLQRSACRKGWLDGTLDAYATLQHGLDHSISAVEETLTDTQRRIVAIWSDVLRVREPLSASTDFFALGGNSITAAQVTARVAQEFAVQLAPATLFADRTIAAFARTVEQAPRQRVSVPSRVARTEQMPPSAAQRRMWFLWQLHPGTTAYNVGGGLRLRGPLDVAVLQLTINELIRRHEVLRTRFQQHDGVLAQHIDEPQPVRIDIEDLGDPREASAERIDALVLTEFQRPFDLQTPPLLRAKLLRLDPLDHVLFVTTHHIAADGTSMALLMEDLVRIYGAFRAGRTPENSQSPLQYIDCAIWQEGKLDRGERDRQLTYWTQQLGREYPDITPHPYRPRPAQPDNRGARLRISIDQSLIQGVQSLANAQGVTVFVVLLAAWKIVLARHSGERDIRVGTPVANRGTVESSSIVGPFINTVVLRTQLEGNPHVAELLHRIATTVRDAQSHEDLPFEELVEALAGDRALSRQPLFQVMHNHQCRARTAFDALAPLEVEAFDGPLPTTEFDLSLNTEEQDGQIRASLKYSPAIYDEPTVARIADHWINALTAIVTDPQARMDEIPLLGLPEQSQLLQTFNDTARHYADSDSSLQRLIEQQVARFPDAEAVVFEGARCTYRELNQRANRLAWKLREHGVGPDVLVGICSERSIGLIVGMLAILKAGGACLPLDPSYPESRLEFILDDAKPRLLLAARDVLDQLPAAAASSAWLLDEEDAGDRDDDLPTITHPHNLAYCLYTSGSTGKPKSAANTQGALLNQLLWRQETYGLEPHDRVLHKTPIGFDVSVWEIFWPLMMGATLVVAAPGAHRDPWRLRTVIEDERVTTLHFVPPMLTAFIEAGELARCESLRRVFVGGQALSTGTQAAFFQQCSAKLYNLYGPTESAIDVSYWECAPSDRDSVIPMGRALANTQLYVLDQTLEPVPIGVVGELYISGMQLARGYTDRPGLTASRFLANPYATGERLYRSGDLVRYRPDGALEYVGRIDHQVKVRGFRIELGEIEACLREHPSVRDAVVLAGRDRLGENELVAHVVRSTTPAEDSERQAQVHDHLAQRLPDYMHPAHYGWLDAFPLLSNGKIDRAALSAHKPASTHKSYTPPQSDIECRVAAIWSEVLEVEKVGLHDSFFELGGHSLLATRAISRVRAAFDIELPLRTLFEATRLAEFAEEVRKSVEGGARNALGPIERVDRSRPLPLSHAQQRMWLLWQLDPQSVAYNLAGVVKLTGPLSYVAIEQTLRVLSERHETLRTTFRVADGVPVQDIAAHVDIPVERLDLSNLSESERQVAIARHAQVEAHRPFDLQAGPLLRVLLLQLGERDHIMIVTTHHVVAEGWAIDVFAREFMELYEGLSKGQPVSLPPLPVQYADYMHWHTQWLASGELERQLDYWKQQLAGEHEVLALPTDRPRPKILSTGGDVHRFTIEPALAQRLRAFSVEHDVTLFMTLLAGYFALLYRYSRQSDLRVGFPVANRTRPEAEGLIGAFLNMQVMRCELSDAMSFKELLARIKEATIAAQSHQDLPFDRLVDAIKPARGLGFHPLYQAIFNLHRWNFERRSRMGDVTIEVLPNDVRAAQLDLMLDVGDSTDVLDCSVIYSTDLFDSVTIERMATYWVELLKQALADQDQRIDSVPLLTDADRTLLDAWGVRTETLARRMEPVHRLIEHQAQVHPRATALICAGRKLSYAELNSRANRLAHRLIAQGTKPESCIGIAVERSVEMVVGLLAVLKAGAAYLPLDPAQPPERLDYMMRDSGISLLLTSSASARRLVYRAPCAVLMLDRLEWLGEAESNPDVTIHEEHPAYTIYTSGSTGMPKGVQVRHRALSNFLLSMRESPGLDSDDVLVAVTSLSFDIAALELYLPLSVGARVVLATEAQARDGHALAELLEEHRATVLQATPASWRLLLAAGWQGSQLTRFKALCGGEALQADLAQQLRDLGVELWNMYGPTETTIWSSTGRVTDGAPSLGRPVAATELRVLTAGLQLAPPGMPGELCIGGDGLARGYLRRAGLTSERFIADPLSTKGERLYRTGDLVRWTADGALEHLGRIDHQVKIRGFRIEPGEIESQLLGQEGVRESAVVARESAAGMRLVAYVAGDADVELNSSTLRERLSRILPDYMVPEHIVVLDRLPLNVNGKLDRRALPEPESIDADNYEAPQGQMEETLAAIWSEVFRVERIGRNDNFFAAGGHSLLAVQLVSRIHKDLGVEIRVRTVFESPTVALLSARIVEEQSRLAAGSPARTVDLRRVDRAGRLSLSPAQRRLWVSQRIAADADATVKAAYAMSARLRLQGELDLAALRAALANIVARHEVLRTIYPEDDEGDPVVTVLTEYSIDVALIDISGRSSEERAEFVEQQAIDAMSTLDVMHGPIVRAKLLRLAPDVHVLVLAVHHIAFDGWSDSVFVEEFVETYVSIREARPARLPNLRVQYVDYADWQARYLSGSTAQTSKNFWKRYLRHAPQTSTLPSDYPRPRRFDTAGDSIEMKITWEVASALTRIANEQQVTLFTLLFATYSLLLHQQLRSHDLVIGTDVAGRNHPDLEALIGFFVNLVPLRSRIDKQAMTFRESLALTKSDTLAAFDHQEVPFDDIVDWTGAAKSLGQNPLVQILFVLQNTPRSSFDIPGLSVELLPAPTVRARFDIAAFVRQEEDEIGVSWVYATALYRPETIRALGTAWLRLLQQIASSSEPMEEVFVVPHTSSPASEMESVTRVATQPSA